MEEDDTPPIPVIVTSERNDLIEAALRAGAADHFSRPVGIVDLEYQVPRTVSNLIKLKRAQHVLSGVVAASTFILRRVS
jgi:CheY-like chemotaxis protein